MRTRPESNIVLVRLGLALAVVISHSYRCCNGKADLGPVFELTGQESLGSIAVNLFFLLSGYLAVASWLRTDSVGDYIRKRIVRIYPAFLAAVALSIAIAAACTRPGPAEYLRGLLWRNDALLQTILYLEDPAAALDQARAFPDNPFPGAVNHSLWSLQGWLICCCLLAGFGLLGGFARKRYIVLVFLVAYAGNIANVFLSGSSFGTFWRLFMYFSAGGAFYMLRDVLAPGSRIIVGLSVAALAASVFVWPLFTAVLPLAGGYLLFSATFSPVTPLAGFFKNRDISYGIYVYAWPIQQAVVHGTSIRDPWLLTVAVLPLVLAVAWLSWMWIEQPIARRRESKPAATRPSRTTRSTATAPALSTLSST